MTGKRFKMSVARTKATGIILEHELSTDEVYNLLMDYKEENEQLKSKLESSKKAHSNCDRLWWELHDEKEQLEKENEKLKSEIQMLKTTIGRNEAHIKRLTEKSDWRTSAYD